MCGLLAGGEGVDVQAMDERREEYRQRVSEVRERETGGDDALFHIPKEPPVAQMSDHSERIHHFTPTDERKTEECGARDDLGVVQVPIREHSIPPPSMNSTGTKKKNQSATMPL